MKLYKAKGQGIFVNNPLNVIQMKYLDDNALLVEYKDGNEVIVNKYNIIADPKAKMKKVSELSNILPKVNDRITEINIKDVQIGDIIEVNGEVFVVDNDVLNKIKNISVPNKLDILGDGSCIACYTFDDETANDLSGDYNGTINGVTYENGKFGKAIKSSVSDRENHITFSESGIDCISNSDIFTVSFWAKIPSPSNYNYPNNSGFTIFGAGTGYNQANCGNRARSVRFGYFDGNFSDIGYFEQPDDGVPCGEGNQIFLNFGIKPDSIFHHFIIIKNGANVKLYLDNVLVDETSDAFVNKTGMKYVTALSKGFSTHSNALSSPGLIDQVRIFNKPLTEEEVQKVYQETSKLIKKIV